MSNQNGQNNTSKWYVYNNLVYCQACNYHSPRVMVYDAAWGKWKEERLISRYCPNCGRRMENGGQDIWECI